MKGVMENTIPTYLSLLVEESLELRPSNFTFVLGVNVLQQFLESYFALALTRDELLRCCDALCKLCVGNETQGVLEETKRLREVQDAVAVLVVMLPSFPHLFAKLLFDVKKNKNVRMQNVKFVWLRLSS